MDTKQFLERVLPEGGLFCFMQITHGKAGGVKHVFTKSVDVLIKNAMSVSERGGESYFGLASFSKDRRLQANTVAVRSLFLDIDCGEEKDYADVQGGFKGLSAFLKVTKLPRPTIVKSGNGLHLYWMLSESISTTDWLPTAVKLKAACVAYGFHVDPAVPTDTARVLRIPGTKNNKKKDEGVTPSVKVIFEGSVHDFSELSKILNKLDLPEPKKFLPRIDRKNMSAVTNALMGNVESSFKKIAGKSLKGNGCAFIAHAIRDAATLPEPEWRAALSIAWVCKDGEAMVHSISKQHAEYSPEATIAKAQETKGPYTCEVINSICPGICDGCKHTISSPIQLGREIARAPTSEALFKDVVPEVVAEMPTSEIDEEIAIYTPPHPYFRGKEGGIYRNEIIEGENEAVVVYENDFYPVSIIDDPNDGMTIIFKLHLPKDPVREFNIPLEDVQSAEKFKSQISKQGVVGNANEMRHIMEYSIRFTKELQRNYMADQARLQFGWADDDKSFIVGNRAYTKSAKFRHNPASSTTGHLIPSLTPTGSLTEWKKSINALAAPGLEPLQLAALSGFGAPLIKFSGVAGGTINLLSNNSGTGKTTAGRIALSIYGNPTDMMLKEDDTNMSREHRVGVMNNLPCLFDEMTNIEPRALSNLIYSITSGRGRNRMERDSNMERINATTWNTIVVTTSNASMIGKLLRHKARADGELMRVIELDVPSVIIPDGHEIFSLLDENYGVAGELYAPWLVKHHGKLTELVDKQKQAIYDKIEVNPSERFWVSIVSCILVGARIAQGMELHDLDLEHLEKWAIGELGTQRAATLESIVDAEGLIGEFLVSNANSIIGASGKTNAITGSNVFHPARGNEVVARFESDTGSMFIAKRALKDYCVERQFTLSDVLKNTQDPGASYVYLGTKKKRLLAGTGVNVPAIDVVEFACSDEELEAIKTQIVPDAEVEH